MGDEKKKRAPRTTKKQIQLIVDFLKVNNILLNNKLQPHEIVVANKAWNTLTELLNSDNVGPIKSVSQWKQVVAELRTNVKKKARDIYVKKKGTGGGPPIKDLNEIENKLYSLMSPVVVEGAEDVEEIGLPSALQGGAYTEPLFVDTSEIMDVSESEEPNQANDVIVNSKQTPKVKYPTKKNMLPRRKSVLDKSIQCQVESTKILAESICKLSQAIETLAVAINSFSEEII